MGVWKTDQFVTFTDYVRYDGGSWYLNGSYRKRFEYALFVDITYYVVFRFLSEKCVDINIT